MKDSIFDRALARIGLVKRSEYLLKSSEYERKVQECDIARNENNGLVLKLEEAKKKIFSLEFNRESLEKTVKKVSESRKSALKETYMIKENYDFVLGMVDYLEDGLVELKKDLSCKHNGNGYEEISRLCRPKTSNRSLKDKINFPRKEMQHWKNVGKIASRIAAVDYVNEVTYVHSPHKKDKNMIDIVKPDVLDIDVSVKQMRYILKVFTTSETPLQSIFVAFAVRDYLKNNSLIYCSLGNDKIRIC